MPAAVSVGPSQTNKVFCGGTSARKIPCLLPRTAYLPVALRSRMPRMFPYPSHIGNAHAPWGVAQAAPAALTDGVVKPREAARSSSAVGVVAAAHSRINFVALIVGG